MTRKLFKNRKGVSTVIGTILMIMVVMAGMSILFGALIVYSDSYHSGSGSSVLESIIVEDAYFKDPNTVRLSIYNTGKVDLTIVNVYINGQMATISPAKLSIIEGDHEFLTMTPPSAFSIGTGYAFKIVTQRGTGFEGTYTW
jgi:hypothetical protein